MVLTTNYLRPKDNPSDDVASFKATGEMTGDDYRKVLIPAVAAALERSGKRRLIYVLGED